jgi:hypothetical protein
MTTPARPEYFLDLYKFAIEMADRVSARRATSNSFFLTLNTGLAAFVGVSGAVLDRQGAKTSFFATVLVSIVGMVLASTWWVLIRSYRDLNSAKFKVILEMEEDLDVKVFGDEWKFLKEDPVRSWARRYAEFSFVERVVPVAFFGVYAASLIHTVTR